jgi:antitoxin component YwqK of YwqJK toxin-antitoxin module
MLLLGSCKNESSVIEETAEEIHVQKGVLYYKSSPFSGSLISYYEVGNQKRFIKIYHKGKLHGKECYWFSNGKLASERSYSHGVKTGKHVGFWPNENLKFEYYFNTKGLHHGAANEWFSNGVPLRSFNYVNGKEEGCQKMFNPDGSLRSNYVVLHGERFGLIGLKKCDAVFAM